MDKVSTEKLNSEQWKYTNSDIFKNFDLNFSPTCKILKQKCNLNEIIIYNGQVTQCGENIKNDKIQIHNIYDALDKNINHFKKIFNTIAPETQDLFFNYNTSNYSGGYYLYIPKNLTPDYVITIKNIISEGSNEAFSNYRNFIHCDENIKATILNEEIFPINQCINIACETYVNKNAQLEIINHSEKPQTKQIYNFSACIDENSKLNYHAIDIFGNLLKNSYYFNLNKPGSECLFNGFNITNNKEHNDNYIQINHNSPYTTSNLNYKIIADGNAKIYNK